MKKKAKGKKIIISLVLLLVVVAAGVYFNQNKKGSDSIRESILAEKYDFGASEMISYEEYIAAYADSDYLEKTAAPVADMKNEQHSLDAGDNEKVTYSFQVPESGLYHIAIDYSPVTDTTLGIVRNLYVNGEIPFQEAEGITFERLWEDSNKDFLMKSDANQAMPLEVQKESNALKFISSSDYSTTGDFAIFFKQGLNTVTLERLQADMKINSISLMPAQKIVSHQEYLAAAKAENIPVITEADMKESITLQAEDTYTKSSPSILPQNNRTSAKTQPYHPTYIVYNTIGGESWKSSGDGVQWQVNVEKEGLYKIGVRFRQALNRGFYSIREIRVNGEVPFIEAAEIPFHYDTNFQMQYLGDENGEFYFHLKEGTNTISMTATLASLSEAAEEVQTSVKNLNNLYRELTAVMGVTPDQYRDYNITASVPNMIQIMKTEYARLDAVIALFGEDVKGGTKTSSLSQMMTILEKVIDKPESITKQLTAFNDKLSSLSSWMLNLGSQPLELDYIKISPDSAKPEKAEAGFFAGLNHTWKAFVGSFTNDYKVNASDSTKKKEELNVWITTATRSQYDIVQSMINERFKDSEYDVKLSMVGADTLLPSTVTGNGPDVAIQLNYSMPTNFAYRKAAYDLTQFSDYNEVAEWFSPAAMEFMEYDGGVYGLPDAMAYPVMFYRKDILKKEGLSVPKTWTELEEIIPYLEAKNMSLFMNTTEFVALGGASATATKQVSPVFLAMLNQNGLELYSEDQKTSELGSNDALQIFKYWTEFYTKQGLAYSVDIVTRFRTGQVPIVIDDYTYRNKLLISAPEIDGDWAIAPIPGTLQADGSVDQTVPCMVGASMIIRNSVEKDGLAEEAWDFLKWWVSAETQQTYNMELKAKDGPAAEYPMSNLEALKSLSIDTESKETIMTTVENLKGIPQVPGGYITGRIISNVFLDVVTNNEDPVDSMYLNVGDINTEIAKKSQEFGLTK